MSLVIYFRDLRQRQYLGVRYDTKVNVYDWDYNMRLAQRDVSNIWFMFNEVKFPISQYFGILIVSLFKVFIFLTFNLLIMIV